MNLILDLGNTFFKVAVFEDDSLLEVENVNPENFFKKIKIKIENYTFQRVIVSNVSNYNIENIRNLLPDAVFLEVSSSISLPFVNKYKTPNTLGIDRICLAAAANAKYPNKNVLVVDAGTCITYEFLNDKNEYLGGAISPGLRMRFKSLNIFTAKLPFLDPNDEFLLTGRSTEESIQSGVINGVIAEIDGVIDRYKEQYGSLTVVLTGGDTNFLDKQLKNSIFASQNFLLFGLNQILTFNSSND